MTQSPLLEMIKENSWEPFQAEWNNFCSSLYFPQFFLTLKNLKREFLFKSPVHGEGHIERVILHGAMLAMDNNLNSADYELLLIACAYHDIGRTSDWIDDLHGLRSAESIQKIIQIPDDDLNIIKGVIEAHSRHDWEMLDILDKYNNRNSQRAIMLSKMLKDADALDRVRISDLNTKYLRYSSTVKRADFSLWFYQQYLKYQVKLNIPIPNKDAYFQKDLVSKTRNKILYYLDTGYSPYTTVIICLKKLLHFSETSKNEGTGAHCDNQISDKACPAVSGCVDFIQEYCRYKDLCILDLTKDFFEIYNRQYTTDICKEIKKHKSRLDKDCSSFLLDIVLFTYKFLKERTDIPSE